LEAPDLTSSKPDLYIALPIVKQNSKAVGFHKEYSIQNFTETNLAVLEEDKNGNLISNPITRLDRNLDEKHRVCFPCAVVEIKHHDVKTAEITKCYCQAANGAATSLSILSRLSHLSTPCGFSGGIQPVVAFTFIGSQSRVWIAFISNKLGKHEPFRCSYVSFSSVSEYATYILRVVAKQTNSTRRCIVYGKEICAKFGMSCGYVGSLRTFTIGR
jgi:hypothetical protein